MAVVAVMLTYWHGQRKKWRVVRTTVNAGSGNDGQPFGYLDKDGKPAGMDIALIQAIDKKSP